MQTVVHKDIAVNAEDLSAQRTPPCQLPRREHFEAPTTGTQGVSLPGLPGAFFRRPLAATIVAAIAAAAAATAAAAAVAHSITTPGPACRPGQRTPPRCHHRLAVARHGEEVVV